MQYPRKQPFHHKPYPPNPSGADYVRPPPDSQPPGPGYNANNRPLDRRPHPPYPGEAPNYPLSRYDYERQWDGVPSFPSRRQKSAEDRENVRRHIQENDRLREVNRQMQSDLDHLNDELTRYKTDYSRLREDLARCRGSNTHLENENTHIIDENVSLKGENSSLETENSNLKNEITSLKSKNSQLTGECSELREDKTRIEIESARLRREARQLRTDSTKMKNEIMQYEADLQLANQDRTMMRVEMFKLEETNGNLQKVLNYNVAKIQQQKSKLVQCYQLGISYYNDNMRLRKKISETTATTKPPNMAGESMGGVTTSQPPITAFSSSLFNGKSSIIKQEKAEAEAAMRQAVTGEGKSETATARTCYVDGFDPGMKEESLMQLFDPEKVKNILMVRQQTQPYAFVNFFDPCDAGKAAETLNQIRLGSNTLTVRLKTT